MGSAQRASKDGLDTDNDVEDPAVFADLRRINLARRVRTPDFSAFTVSSTSTVSSTFFSRDSSDKASSMAVGFPDCRTVVELKAGDPMSAMTGCGLRRR